MPSEVYVFQNASGWGYTPPEGENVPRGILVRAEWPRICCHLKHCYSYGATKSDTTYPDLSSCNLPMARKTFGVTFGDFGGWAAHQILVILLKKSGY